MAHVVLAVRSSGLHDTSDLAGIKKGSSMLSILTTRQMTALREHAPSWRI